MAKRDHSPRPMKRADGLPPLTPRSEDPIPASNNPYELMKVLPYGLLVMNSRGRIDFINAELCRMFGYDESELLDQPIEILLPRRYHRTHAAQRAGFQGKPEPRRMGVGRDLTGLHKTGYEFPVEVGLRPMTLCGEAVVIAGIVDITARKKMERRLHDLANSDGLTGLANRTLLIDHLQLAIARLPRSRDLAALVFLDLDHFKPVNDRYGHAAGDAVLIEIAHRLRLAVRPTDTAARLGGDEFVVILTELHTVEHCERVVERIHQAVAAPIHLPQGGTVRVSASIGVDLIRDAALDADTVLRRADQTMYTVKKFGRNGIRFFDAQAEERMAHLDRLHEEVRIALAEDRFELHYQPQIDLNTQALIGFEALLRWRDHSGRLRAPGEFQSALDDEVLAAPIGEWVINKALLQLASWQRAGIPCRKISINISPQQFQQRNFATRLRDSFAAVPEVSPKLIELEIVESAAIQDISAARSIIDECRAMGISFALDDFGTGYSSLTYFRQLPIKTIKIDKSFVINMLGSSDDHAIVSSVIKLCETFGRQVIAEGVETERHNSVLRDLGCTCGQGFGIARPLPPDDATDWLRRHNSNASHPMAQEMVDA
jgi:diguanylate cyclase